MDMQLKWQQRQNEGRFTSAKDWLEDQKKKADEAEERKNQRVNEIMNKYSTGAKLTQKELRYLQTRNPAAYARIQAAEAERRIYEKELQSCRTKDEFQRYKMTHLVQSLSNVKAAMNDPSMPVEKKLEAVMGEKRKIDEVNKAEKEFIQRGDYARLPSQAEKMKAERDMKRAKEEELRAAKEKEAEKKEQAEAVREKNAADKARREQLRQERKAERESQDHHNKKSVRKKRVTSLSKSRKKTRFKKARYTASQAQNTYEARKIRRANARASFARSYLCPSGITADKGTSLDVTA